MPLPRLLYNSYIIRGDQSIARVGLDRYETLIDTGLSEMTREIYVRVREYHKYEMCTAMYHVKALTQSGSAKNCFAGKCQQLSIRSLMIPVLS